jgi:hypothetical protein
VINDFDYDKMPDAKEIKNDLEIKRKLAKAKEVQLQ